MKISSTEAAGRPRPYQVCNSRPRGKAAGYEVRRRARGEARIESVVEFEYGPICPADGTQVMEPTRKFLWLTPTEGETLGKCSVVATGEVDDYATVTIAGETQETESGDNVPIDMKFEGLPPGIYGVTVTHEDVCEEEPQYNESYLKCEVRGGAGTSTEDVEIIPEDNDDVGDDGQDDTPDEEGKKGEESSDCEDEGEETAPGGEPAAETAREAGAQAVTAWGSTSGGRAASSASTARRMTWTAQFGVFRGLAQMPTGRLEISQGDGYDAILGQQAGLEWVHPLSTSLEVGEEGVKPNMLLALRQGRRVTNFWVEGSGESALAVGASSQSTIQITGAREMSPTAAATCGITAGKYIRASFLNGGSTYYDPASGACVGYISSGGYVMSAERAEQYIKVIRDEAGVIRQIWNRWDGLADVAPEAEGGYSISIYPPEQVQAKEETTGLYRAEGEPVRVFRVQADKERKALSIHERDLTNTRMSGELVTRWWWADDAWSMSQGEGEEAIETVRQRRMIDKEEKRYEVVTTLILGGGEMASRERCEYKSTNYGELMLSKTVGYGSDGAITTDYTYDEKGQLKESNSPQRGRVRLTYDAQGRVISRSEPWADVANGVRIVETKYRSDEYGYSDDVAQEDIIYSTNAMLRTWQRTRYAYTETPELLRVERRVQEMSGTGANPEVIAERVSVSETWRADATEAYAAGRVKMTRDEDGVEKHYQYTGTSAHRALYVESEETRVAGRLIPGQSRRTNRYVDTEGNTRYEEEYVLLADGEWRLVNTAEHSYDKLNRLIGTAWANGRRMSRALTCQGKLLWEVDADGVRTDYAYDSARQLVETIRSETPTTPETITAYRRDAAGRVLQQERCIGPMKSVLQYGYDLQGRLIHSVDELGRTTLKSYSADGLTTTTITPAGAILTDRYNPDNSLAEQSGDGQRHLRYAYDYVAGRGLRTRTLLPGGEVIQESLLNGFGDVAEQSVATSQAGQMLTTRTEYNERGQMSRQQVGSLAPVTYAYDSMGNLERQTLLLSPEAPEDATKNRIIKQTTRWEQAEDEAYLVVTRHQNTPDGEWLASEQWTLASKTSPALVSESIIIDTRGNRSREWTSYGEGTERTARRRIPTSDVVAEQVIVDGFTTSATDNTGITTTYTRRYLEAGLLLTETDGRGNATTTKTDIASRPIEVTNAAGDTTTTLYEPTSNNPAVITNALGHDTCYAYDIRGRKVAEWGTGAQPAAFAYDDADRLTALTTWRVDGETISADPRGLTDGDVTRWEYNDACGLTTRMVYADGSATEFSYNADNLLIFKKDARSVVTAYDYDALLGLLTRVSYATPQGVPLTPAQEMSYDIYGRPTRVADAAGERAFTYDRFGAPETESFSIGETLYALTESWDTFGRNTGYHLEKDGGQICADATGYAADGRIATAAFAHNNEPMKEFSFAYLPGSNLLQTLAMPNGMRLEQAYEEKRNLLATMSYLRGSSLVVRRSYAYDALGAPASRKTERRGGVMLESFSYNPRQELTGATRGADSFAYNYDNIGNRISAQQMAEQISYAANELNQYTQITTNGAAFAPKYDANGNQTLIQTATGIWSVEYNADNRIISLTSADGSSVLTCAYDYMGRRFEKKLTVDGAVSLHQRFLYRGYLQIAALDMLRSHQPALWYITWDPTQPVATRPLAIRTAGSWFTYGWDLTKNITELFTPAGQLDTDYVYTPFGEVRPAGNLTQPIQWSSECFDPETALVYYNYRYYNPQDGRWTRRDPIGVAGGVNVYVICNNNQNSFVDTLGLSFLSCLNKYCKKLKDASIKAAIKAMIKQLCSASHQGSCQETACENARGDLSDFIISRCCKSSKGGKGSTSHKTETISKEKKPEYGFEFSVELTKDDKTIGTTMGYNRDTGSYEKLKGSYHKDGTGRDINVGAGYHMPYENSQLNVGIKVGSKNGNPYAGLNVGLEWNFN